MLSAACSTSWRHLPWRKLRPLKGLPARRAKTLLVSKNVILNDLSLSKQNDEELTVVSGQRGEDAIRDG